MRACNQSSIFSTGGKFRHDYGLLLELHALTLVTHSYALLLAYMSLICNMWVLHFEELESIMPNRDSL